MLDANANAVVRLAKRGVSDYEGNVDAHCVVRAVTRSRGRERRVARADLVEGKGTHPILRRTSEKACEDHKK